MKNKFLATILSIVFIISLITGVIAAVNYEEIEAVISFDTEIKYNDEIQEFTDVTGANVYPIMYEGTNYLPVRAMSNLAGIEVYWDEETETIILEEKN